MILKEDMLNFIIAENHQFLIANKISMLKNVEKMMIKNSTNFQYLRNYGPPRFKYHLNRIGSQC